MTKPKKSLWEVTCKQVVDAPSDPWDRKEFNLSLNGRHIWECRATGRDDAIKRFHAHYSFGCREDYEFTAKEVGG